MNEKNGILKYLGSVRHLINILFRLIAELNRTPFDFSEGESELVSGFNVEYRRGGFVSIFLSEYSRILFIRFLFIDIFFRINFKNLIQM